MANKGGSECRFSGVPGVHRCGVVNTGLVVSALTMDVPVIDFMVINIIVIAAPLLQCQMLILMLKSSLYM